MKKISIIGSTGSIGTQSLTVAAEYPEEIKVIGLSTNKNIDLLEEQINTFHPKVVCVMDPDAALTLKKRLSHKNVEVLSGIDGLIAVSTLPGCDLLLTAVSGMIGLKPTLAAISEGIDIALANKETLVAAGKLVMKAAADKDVSILPVDSEHSAIFQCLRGNPKEAIKRIIITASGGPFRNKNADELKSVTLEQALKHPNWAMGQKITIDSASLMNKGLEVIEAKWLFDLELPQIDVIVHPQSIIHSMVEFVDHSTIAQMGMPDMALPIQYAFFYPDRVSNNRTPLDFKKASTLTFEDPDIKRFPCLGLAFDALKLGGSSSCVLNAANEIAVERFLNRQIGFLDIPRINEAVMDAHQLIADPGLSDILESDAWARDVARHL
ncbi:1-deoxy-D-xylulose-5-phosphate reductoisomerase [Eubacteriaceae bacterium ES3]|nr:1-deoxy-D-xylulose-5-phosphate reductoisomerase [Eubacteriaceae bacterium ES3]